MKIKDKKKHEKSKQNLKKRLEHKTNCELEPVFKAKKIQYEIAERVEGINCGGIGAIHMLAQATGLIETIDREIKLLKEQRPYHESDHILNMMYNILAGGTCLEDIGHLRENPEYMNCLDAQRIPDQTTEGDFLRRFKVEDIEKLMDEINKIRVKIWEKQSWHFRAKAMIDIDATVEETTGKCKQGMDISYDGRWGYAPLIVSLSNSREILFIENRSGNTSSGWNAAKWLDKSIALTREVFGEVWLRGDTDYSQSSNLDRWARSPIRFWLQCDVKPHCQS